MPLFRPQRPLAGATSSTEPSEIKPLAPVRLIKTGGHTHRFVLHEAVGELYAAGHGKLEVLGWL